MTTALLVVVVAVALACPLHMLWRASRGRRGCCAPQGSDAASIAARERELATQVRELSAGTRAGD